MSIRVLIADGHQRLRDGLRCILEPEDDIEVIGEAGDGRTVVDMARALLPDVVIMGIGMPRLNGVDATRQIRTENPPVKVIALSIHSNKLYVLGMLEAGASGYVLKAAAYDELRSAVRAVSRGKSYLSPDITGVVVDADLRTPSESDAHVGSIPEKLRLEPTSSDDERAGEFDLLGNISAQERG